MIPTRPWTVWLDASCSQEALILCTIMVKVRVDVKGRRRLDGTGLVQSNSEESERDC